MRIRDQKKHQEARTKDLQEALRAERDRLELISQHIGAGLAIISKDYRTLWANKVLKQIFGKVEGKICYYTYNQRSEVCPGCGVLEVFQTGKPKVVHEQVGKDKHGRTIWSQIIATPIKDKKGNITSALEVVVPITERKKAEEALKESEEKYRLLIENIKEGIYSTHRGIFTNVNESMCRMFGYTKEELIGMPSWHLAVPETRNSVRKMFFQKEAKKDFSPVEVKCVRKDGSVFMAEVRLGSIWEKQQFTGVVSDITDRKRAEEALQESERKYRTLVETAQVGISLADPQENILFASQALTDLLEYKREELLGKNLKEICDEAQYAIFKNETEKRKKGVSSKYEAKLQTKSGKSKCVYISAAPLFGEDGSFLGSLGVLSDLTEIKKAREYDILLNTSQALSQTLKFDQVIKIGAEKMIQTLNADRCGVLLVEEQPGKSEVKVEIYPNKSGLFPHRVKLNTTRKDFHSYKRFLQKEGHLQVFDVRHTSLPKLGKRILRRTGMISSLVLPIILREKMLGVFHVGMTKKRKTFSPEEIGLAQTMTNQVGVALQNSILMDDLDKERSRLAQQAELVESQYREQKMLFELSQALSSAIDLDQLLQLATQKVTELLGTERSSIALLNSDGESVTIQAIHPSGRTLDQDAIGFTFTSESFPQLKMILTQHRPFIFGDVSLLPKGSLALKYFQSRGIKSTVCIPLVSRGKALGFLAASTVEKVHEYTPAEIRLLQTISNPIAVSIENLLLLENLKKQTQRLQRQTEEKDILLKVSHSLSKTMDLDEVVKVGAKVVGKALGVERCVVFLATEDGKHVEVKGIFSSQKADVHQHIGAKFFIADDPRWKNLVEKRSPFVIHDVSLLPSPEEFRAHWLKEGIKSLLGAGMFFGSKAVGVLALSSTKDYKTFSQEELKLIQTIANQMAGVIKNAQLLQVVRRHTQDLKNLSSQLMKAQESERKRMAQELHDQVGQMLQSMKMNLDRIKRNLTLEPKRMEETKDWLIDTEKLLSLTIDDIRTLTFDLRPSMLDDFGLVPTLRWYIEDFSRRSNIKVFLKGEEEKCRFPPEIEISLYRIIQEALTNVAKHAHATEVSIHISQKHSTQTGERLSTAILSVKDNGIGFDTSSPLSSPHKGMGIFNMKERANLLGGSFEIISQPHKGTRVNVKIPFTEVKHEEDQITGG